MQVESVTVEAFRNLARATIEFDPTLNLIHGDNAQGKTNLVEAVYLLGSARSFRGSLSRECITWGEDSATIRGAVEDGGVRHSLSIRLTRAGRSNRAGEKDMRPADFLQYASVVAFTPEDLGIAGGAPDQRRRFIDRAAFACRPAYLDEIRAYFRSLRARNAVLREHGGAAALDEACVHTLAAAGARITVERGALTALLSPLAAAAYRDIAGGDEEVELLYRPGARVDHGAREKDLELQLAGEILSRRARDRERGFTSLGPHLDDVEIAIGGRPLRHVGSQGQRRSAVIALKLAEIDLVARRRGRPPVLILDDVQSELDARRVRGLLSRVAASSCQVFLTAARSEPGVELRGGAGKRFVVSGGRVRETLAGAA